MPEIDLVEPVGERGLEEALTGEQARAVGREPNRVDQRQARQPHGGIGGGIEPTDEAAERVGVVHVSIASDGEVVRADHQAGRAGNVDRISGGGVEDEDLAVDGRHAIQLAVGDEAIEVDAGHAPGWSAAPLEDAIAAGPRCRAK